MYNQIFLLGGFFVFVFLKAHSRCIFRAALVTWCVLVFLFLSDDVTSNFTVEFNLLQRQIFTSNLRLSVPWRRPQMNQSTTKTLGLSAQHTAETLAFEPWTYLYLSSLSDWSDTYTYLYSNPLCQFRNLIWP